MSFPNLLCEDHESTSELMFVLHTREPRCLVEIVDGGSVGKIFEIDEAGEEELAEIARRACEWVGGVRCQARGGRQVSSLGFESGSKTGALSANSGRTLILPMHARRVQLRNLALRRKNKPNRKQKTIMKKILIPLLALCASAAIAAEETTTTTTKTTTSRGTISEYAPGTTFVVKETSGPVTYRYGKKVTYVTKSGKTLTDEDVKTRIKVGVPVSVHYATEGDNRVINRVEIDD